MTMATKQESSFVADGHERARAASKAEVRAAVEQKYTERFAQANWLQRCLLRWKMQREVSRALDEKAPPGGLYLSAHSKG
jgi:hypothetical protein